jgi:Zn ribbon nucleic-acid-binding protein
MAKNAPIIKCLHCGHSWKRRMAGSRKLEPPPQCSNPDCWAFLKTEGEDYEWLSTGGFAYQQMEKEVGAELKKKLKEQPTINTESPDIFDLIR